MLATGQFTIRVQDCLLCAEPGITDILCAACADDLPRLPQPCCRHCALPVPAGDTCGRCLNKPPHFDTARAVFAYDFPLDKLVQSFKYGHRLALAVFFSRRLIELAKDRIEDSGPPDLIVPMPLHSRRLRERGFNQALELARPLGKSLRIPVDATLCRRLRDTRPQTGLHWRERVRNIRGAFDCTTDLSGKRILLVDDVMTTGASLNECARIVKRHGAARVSVLVLARALP